MVILYLIKYKFLIELFFFLTWYQKPTWHNDHKFEFHSTPLISNEILGTMCEERIYCIHTFNQKGYHMMGRDRVYNIS